MSLIARLRAAWLGPPYPEERLKRFRYHRPGMSEDESIAAVSRGVSEGVRDMRLYDEQMSAERWSRIRAVLLNRKEES